MTDPVPPTIEWVDGAVRLIDQRRLPGELLFLDCRTVSELVEAIATLAVRGAPALGVAGAYGVVLAAGVPAGAFAAAVAQVRAARPTAVNLAWGVDQALAAYRSGGVDAARDRAHAIAADDLTNNRAIGAHGAALLPDRARVLTHCNAGALACVGYGTALGVIRSGFVAGKVASVWVDETRPLRQGARLTAWELERLGIPFHVIVDAAAGSLFAAGLVDAVVVGADRIAANGDVANKIGTYGLAVLAHAHDVPFYVAAPSSTLDAATATGAAIEIEHRDGLEVGTVSGHPVFNPAFDVTPARLVTAVITEHGTAEAGRPTR